MAVANDHSPKPTAMRLAVVMVHATLATLIDVVIFTGFSLRLNKLSIQTVETHAHMS